jgi:purine-binding chemotaxis protein CheW
LKFTLNYEGRDENTVVIVLTIVIEDKSRTIGFVVDAVSDVLDVHEKDIKPDPLFFGGGFQKNILKA